MHIRDSPQLESALSFILPFLLKLLFLSGSVCLISLYILSFFRMSGNQMYPSVRDGDLCICYRLDHYRVDDVVVYRTERGERKISRILATGGQKVEIMKEGGILVNGQIPAEEIPYLTCSADTDSVSYPVVLAENQVFLLNDYRSDTSDSREYGPVNLKKIEGKIFFLIRRRGF